MQGHDGMGTAKDSTQHPHGADLTVGTGTGSDIPMHIGAERSPMSPRGPNSPCPPQHSPYLTHVKLEEPPLLLHVLGHLRCGRLSLDDPCQAGSLLLLLHLPPAGQDVGRLGTALPRGVSHAVGYGGDGIRRNISSPSSWERLDWSPPNGKLASIGARLQPRDKTSLCGAGLGGFCQRQRVPYTLVS